MGVWASVQEKVGRIFGIGGLLLFENPNAVFVFYYTGFLTLTALNAEKVKFIYRQTTIGDFLLTELLT